MGVFVVQLLISLGGSLMLAILKTFSDNLVDRSAEIENFHFENFTFCFERIRVSKQRC